MDVKETFLKLTEYTTPFKSEHELRPLLPEGLIEDAVGNYYITIGKSESLFVCHLDTYCTKKEKVEHVIEGHKIGCTGSTTLGGDNKSGVVILMYMIEQNIPGTYYFFIGEEAMSGGRYGSQQILNKNPEFFKNFKRCIAFDRKAYGSLITRQSARFTCSDEFAKALISDLGKAGLEYKVDITGWYTDSVTFMDVIPEVTNLSNGTFNEHTNKEFINVSYLEAVCEVACEVDWENLPTVREPKAPSTSDDSTMKYLVKADYKKTKKYFHQIVSLLSAIGFKCLNFSEFKPGREMLFAQWHNPLEASVKVYPDYFTIDGHKMKDKKDVYAYYKIAPEVEELDEEELFDGICWWVTKELDEDTFDLRDNYSLSVDDFMDICDEIGIDYILVKQKFNTIKFLEMRGSKILFMPSKY